MKRFQRILLAAGLLVSLSGYDAISDPSSDIPEQIVVADSTTEPSDAETAEAVTESNPSLAETESASESTAHRPRCFPKLFLQQKPRPLQQMQMHWLEIRG